MTYESYKKSSEKSKISKGEQIQAAIQLKSTKSTGTQTNQAKCSVSIQTNELTNSIKTTEVAVQTEQEENNEKCEQDIYNKLAGMINTLNNNYIHSIQALDVKVSNLNTLVMSVGESICNNNQMQFNMTPHNSQAIPSSLPDSQVVPGSSDEDMPNDISFMINDILSGNMSQSQESSSSTTYTGLPGMSDEMSPTFPLIPKKVMPGEAPENKNRVTLHLKIQALQCSK